MAFDDVFPQSLREAIDGVIRIPSYGERGASRFIYNLLKLSPQEREEVVNRLLVAVQKLRPCGECYLLSETDPCPVCSNPKRSKRFICVVEESQDAYTIERLERYTGVYHVLGGRIAPLEGVSPQDLTVDKLLERIQENRVKEVIIATNPNVEGEATASYLIKLISSRFPGVKATRVSLGLQFGSLIELSDELSLERSIENRR